MCICLKQLCTWCNVSVCMIRNGSNVHMAKTTVHVICFILFIIRNIHETNVHVSNTTRPNNVCALCVQWLRQLCMLCDFSLFMIRNIHETNVHMSNTTSMHVATKHICTVINNASTCTPCCSKRGRNPT